MAWEYAILNFINENLSSPLLDDFFTFITHLSDGGAIWIVTALTLLCIPKYRRWGVCLAAVLLSGAVINTLILKPLIARPRPFEGFENIMLLISPPTDASFPSGHTLASVSSAIVLLFADKRIGIPALILATLIAYSRMYLYVHFPTDILAGIILAAIISSICIIATKRFGKRDK